jgi:predicted dehydrogenase/nucleoside-diphosphate-sugar epimerase
MTQIPAPGSRQQPPLRIGLVGAGRMGLQHAKAIGRTSTSAILVGVAEPALEAAAEFRRAFPQVATFDSLGAMLATAELDAVHIVTPPATHEALAAAALEAGCHAYVEKPVAETAAGADRLLALAAARGRILCPGHQLLFERPTVVAAELFPALGRLVHLESYFAFRPVRHRPDGRAPLRTDLQLLDILPHPVYLLVRFLELATSGETDLAAIELGERGSVHALVRRGGVTGSLVVTLEGRPVESFVRLVGTNGTVEADFVRGTTLRLIGPGTSGIDKVLAPYRAASQLAGGTTRALAGRLRRGDRSYPGLREIFEAFYRAIRSGGPPPISHESIRLTTRICERIALEIGRRTAMTPVGPAAGAAGVVLVTGGTGFLGQAVVRALSSWGVPVRALGRREPAPWDRVTGVDYRAADMGEPLPPALLDGVRTVMHCAAETAGGWSQHQRNSIDATEHLLRAAAAAGVRELVHVSSIAVLSAGGRGPISEDTPLDPNPRRLGPYVWGKLESERLARRLGQELGVAVKIVRPGAIVDHADFDPPGRLGRRLGGLFVAVGSPSHRLGTVELGLTASMLGWMARHFDQVPAVLNLLQPELPEKRELVGRLRRANPGLRVVWLPTFLLHPLSWAALLAQRVLRRGSTAISLARVFGTHQYDTGRIRALADVVATEGAAGPTAEPTHPGPSPRAGLGAQQLAIHTDQVDADRIPGM